MAAENLAGEILVEALKEREKLWWGEGGQQGGMVGFSGCGDWWVWTCGRGGLVV